MKRAFVLGSIFLLCACSPSTSEVGKRAQVELQKKLDASSDFEKDHLVVERLVAVHKSGANFLADATINAHGKDVHLPLTITADRNNVIIGYAASDWGHFGNEVRLSRGALFAQSYSDVVLKTGIFKDFMPRLLRPDLTSFKHNLETVVPVDVRDGYWFGTGCRAHECGSDEAAWAVSEDTGVGYAVIMNSDGKGDKDFKVYIDSGDLDGVPAPLQAWALQNGATPVNTVVAHDDYRSK